MPEPTRQILTASEAATILDLTDGRIRQLARAGTLKAVKFGRDWQIDRAAVEAYAALRQALRQAQEEP